MKPLFFDVTYFGKLYWREPGSAEVLPPSRKGAQRGNG